MKESFATRIHRLKPKRVSLTWLLLTVILAIALSVGACALLLPDRPPALLGNAEERQSAPVNTQRYTGAQKVKMIPTLAAKTDLIGNAGGTVTGNWAASGLTSGKAAYKADNRSVTALATATPLYRDLKQGDAGEDVLALNNELNRLGYGAVPGSNNFSSATSAAVRTLMKACGNTSDGTLAMPDILWIPNPSVRTTAWSATLGAILQPGTPVGQVPGGLTKLTLKNGQPADKDRTLTVFGQKGVLPAGKTEITDAGFCGKVAATDDYRDYDEASLTNGIDASLALATPINVLRVPAAAVFGTQGSKGCIAVPKDKANPDSGAFDVVKVNIEGAQLGTSLVQTKGTDAGSIRDVAIGSRIADESCR